MKIPNTASKEPQNSALTPLVLSLSYCVLVLEGVRMQPRHRTLREHADCITASPREHEEIKPLD
jgi:hypothetical protein